MRRFILNPAGNYGWGHLDLLILDIAAGHKVIIDIADLSELLSLQSPNEHSLFFGYLVRHGFERCDDLQLACRCVIRGKRTCLVSYRPIKGQQATIIIFGFTGKVHNKSAISVQHAFSEGRFDDTPLNQSKSLTQPTSVVPQILTQSQVATFKYLPTDAVLPSEYCLLRLAIIRFNASVVV